jgi:4-hydroxy-3-methylbut-2-enyl diphosphate reductase
VYVINSKILKYFKKGQKIDMIIHADTGEERESTHKTIEQIKIICHKADIVLVRGGRNSSNTLRLTEICSNYTFTKHIETANEIEPSWFTDKRIIGITAGASTPSWIIEEIKNGKYC